MSISRAGVAVLIGVEYAFDAAYVKVVKNKVAPPFRGGGVLQSPPCRNFGHVLLPVFEFFASEFVQRFQTFNGTASVSLGQERFLRTGYALVVS